LKLKAEKSNLNELNQCGNCVGKNTGTCWLDASWADPVKLLHKAAVGRSKAKRSLMDHELLISTQIVFVPYIYIVCSPTCRWAT
jgi:hypothetical protein